MQWQKLGLVFCPADNYEWMVSHAAVPFAEQIDGNLFGIFFSTRDSKNRSHVGHLEVDISQPSSIVRVSNKPLLSPGALGTFDDSGAMPSWIVKHNQKKYLYYIGWNLGVTVPFRNAIGLAIGNEDSNIFFKYSEGPIFDRNPVEPYFSANSCVLIDHNIWRMWYLSCVKWELVNGVPQHWYHIKYAESDDGINWVRTGIICIDFKSKEEYAISRPCVLKDGELYKMWYSYRGTSYRIGYAESEDGIHWTRMDEQVGIDVSESGWDSEMIEYPQVFDHQGRRYMLYNGNGYGRTGFGLAVLVEE